jgi:Peptidase family M1 domain
MLFWLAFALQAVPGGAAEEAAAATAGAAVPPAVLERQVDEAALEPGRAVAVKHVELSAGLAKLRLETGVLIPVTPAGGRTLELVFAGEGRIELEPPDAIEAGQLDLFTGRRRLDEEIGGAVLVVGMDGAVGSLLKKPAAAPTAAQLAAAQELYGQWKKRERRVIGIEDRILARASGDPALAGYFAALCRSGRLGDFLYVFDPQDQEQVSLGRLVPLDATEKEKKKLLKEIARGQRNGHMTGLELEDLGTWDTWVSTALRDAQGRPLPGASAFEPVSYDLDADVADSDLRLTGRARVELRPILKGARTVHLRLNRDLQVSRVTEGGDAGAPGARAVGTAGTRAAAGNELSFHRRGTGLTVVLPRPLAAGETLTLVVEYSGRLIEKDWNRYALLSTLDWYPHAGAVDRARYAATFHWPKKLELVASGHRLGGGDGPDGRRWERRALDQPNLAFSFEVGRFKLQTVQAGHVKVTLAFDPDASRFDSTVREEIAHTVADSLVYYESVFGPYPMDELAVVTVPRGFSQGTQGLVTLSDVMMGDWGLFGQLLGLSDRRAVIAHEVAHQWWGDAVGWASYRDQWISEALASYCALRYTRQRLAPNEPKKSIVGLTARWRDSLTAEIADGRTVESMGPVVLGVRLVSSLSSAAYQDIVYDKGAVVLDTLAYTLGPDVFPEALRQVFKATANQTLSTEDLLAMIGKVTSTDLSTYAERYIYGTGLPMIFYTYRFEPGSAGGFRMVGSTRQEMPPLFRYRVVRSSAGHLDVGREAVAGGGPAPALLAVPADVEFYDPQRPGAGRGKKANATVRGRFVVRGESNDFSIDVPGEPKAFFLDRHAEVFALFVDESRHPRRGLLLSARHAADRGKVEEAEALFAKALATEEKEDVDAWYLKKWAQRLLTADIQLGRARLYLQQGRDGDAEQALDRADLPSGAAGGWAANERDVLLSWLDVRRGRFDRAFHRLDRSRVDTAESTLLLAIAAQATGRKDDLDKALKSARRKGADASLLLPAAAAMKP